MKTTIHCPRTPPLPRQVLPSKSTIWGLGQCQGLVANEATALPIPKASSSTGIGTSLPTCPSSISSGCASPRSTSLRLSSLRCTISYEEDRPAGVLCFPWLHCLHVVLCWHQPSHRLVVDGADRHDIGRPISFEFVHHKETIG